MKRIVDQINYSTIERFLFASLIAVGALLVSFSVRAQDIPEKVDVDIETEETMWYGQPWVWVVGVALFIIVIVAITRSGSGRRDS
ncbi:MAG TPA: hypothetical protein VGE26_03550 [Sphingobacteriaceae bacterium]